MAGSIHPQVVRRGKRAAMRLHMEEARARMPWAEVGAGMFQLRGGQGAYWKAPSGWWASRRGEEAIAGPFPAPEAARAWAEAPLVEAASLRARERSLNTWGGLPEAEQAFKAGQVWRRRDPRYARHEILLVKPAGPSEWICFCRVVPSRNWGVSRPVRRKLSNLTMLYRLVQIEEPIP